jgi:Flp pilus assembly protein TadG
MQTSGGQVCRFGRDAKGSAALLFGLALIPILLGIGTAIDYGRALIVRERMAEAADSAALAIGSWQGLSQDELKIKAQQSSTPTIQPARSGRPPLSM